MRPLILSLFLAASVASYSQMPAKKFTCATCHVEEARTQPATSMGHAMEPADHDPVLLDNPKLEFQKGPFHYLIEQHGNQATYSVSDGAKTLSFPIQWPLGRMSQTWILNQNGQLSEGLVSYYPGAKGLDITIGDQSLDPKTLEEAVGRPIGMPEAKLCFGCHASNAVVARKLSLETALPGVNCQHCHKGADDHMAAISQGKPTPMPARLHALSAEDTSSFCGQCHRTWQTVVRNQWMGVINVRFQPYRLAKSKCFDGVDDRMKCTTCHNPHREVVNISKEYDSYCLACHSEGAKPSAGMIAAHPELPADKLQMPICKVAKENCSNCHMPQVDLPGSHRTFTDHDVRIVKAGERYPE